MRTIKKITKKYKGATFSVLPILNLTKLIDLDTTVTFRLSEKELSLLISKLQNTSCIAVEHKGVVYLCSTKGNYSLALEQIKAL